MNMELTALVDTWVSIFKRFFNEKFEYQKLDFFFIFHEM